MCILGEEKEPCFEGANITVDFSLDENFNATFKEMIYQLQEIIDKGGNNTMPNKIEEEALDFKKKEEEKEEEKNQNSQDESGETDKNKTDNNKEETKEKETKDNTEKEDDEDKKKKTKYSAEEEKCPKCGKPMNECVCKGNYSLDEIPEYVELKQNYSDLETKFSAQETEINDLKQSLSELTAFKASVEKKEKEDMIKSFYMLSDEDKKDVLEHVDEYSLNDIEAKLSILCVRNKVNFNLDEEKEEKIDDPTTYNLNGEDMNDAIPAWAKAVMANQENS